MISGREGVMDGGLDVRREGETWKYVMGAGKNACLPRASRSFLRPGRDERMAVGRGVICNKNTNS